MARTSTRLGLFLLLAIGLDLGLGALLARLNDKTFTGERGGLTNLALSKDADILVLGSSRAQFHVMPSVLEKQLGGAVYNAGLKGHDLLYSVMLADLWKKRHGPAKSYVLTMDMESLQAREQESAAALILAPYLDQSERVREVLYADSPWKRFMYLSRSYRYNGRVFPIIRNLLFVQPPAQYDGWLPLDGKFDPTQPPFRHGMNDVPRGVVASDAAAIASSEEPYSELKVRLFKDFARDVHQDNARLFVVHPPIWGLPQKAHATWTRRVRELLASLPGTEFVDLCEYAYPEQFRGRPELMNDFNHLREEGALLFSTLLAERMRPALGRQLEQQAEDAARGAATRQVSASP
jgi:hypothetical protein